MCVDWRGVIPAITTPFLDDRAVDGASVSARAAWWVASGRAGVGRCGARRRIALDGQPPRA